MLFASIQYVEQNFTYETIDARFVCIVIGNIDAMFNLFQDGEHPLAVLIKQIAAHDKHIKHMRPITVNKPL